MHVFLETLCASLNKHKINYAVAGGYAVALYGAVRGTIDVDLVLKLSKKNLVNIQKALEEIGLQSKLPLQANDVYEFRKEYIKNRNLIAWSFIDPKDPTKIVDLILTYEGPIRKKSITVGDQTIPLLAKNELIKMKRESGRPQDIEDIKALEKL